MSSHPSNKLVSLGSADLWFVPALGVAQICSWGSLYYSFPLIAEAMGTELGWPKTQLYGAVTLGLILAGVVIYPVGVAIDRGYGRWVMAGGSILAGGLLIAWSQVSSLLLFYGIFAGIGSLHAATLYEPAFAVVTKRMGADRARRGITTLTLWAGFASTVFVPLIQLLLEQVGWRGTLIALGSLNIILCGSLYAAVIRPSRDVTPPVSSQTNSLRLTGHRAVSWALRSVVFWALALAFVAYAATVSAFMFHLYPLLLERGLAPSAVVTVLAVIGPAQVVGRIVILLLASQASIQMMGSLVVAIFPLVLFGIANLPPVPLILIGIAALYGAANGVMTIVRGLAVPEMLTRQAYGTLNGALVAPALIAQAVAPVSAAALWATTGSYDAVLIALLVGSLIFAAGFWTAVAMRRMNASGYQDGPD